jgi:hypothetical protein
MAFTKLNVLKCNIIKLSDMIMIWWTEVVQQWLRQPDTKSPVYLSNVMMLNQRTYVQSATADNCHNLVLRHKDNFTFQCIIYLFFFLFGGVGLNPH